MKIYIKYSYENIVKKRAIVYLLINVKINYILNYF